LASRIAGIARELPERPGACRGEVQEATLDQLVDVLARELRSGILSVSSQGPEGGSKSARIVLRSGRSISEPIDCFVERVKPAIAASERASYAFEETAAGRLDSIAPPASVQGDDERQLLQGRRVLVSCSRAARAQSLAAQLRDRGALVVVACGAENELDRARALDPEVAVISAADIQGPCSRLVEELRADLRLRWSSLLVIPDELPGSRVEEPDLIGPLAARIARLASADRDLRERARSTSRFETRLEIIGPRQHRYRPGRRSGSGSGRTPQERQAEVADRHHRPGGPAGARLGPGQRGREGRVRALRADRARGPDAGHGCLGSAAHQALAHSAAPHRKGLESRSAFLFARIFRLNAWRQPGVGLPAPREAQAALQVIRS
jgi:hypothetical protein